MYTIHHLENSRSQRLIWLCEELNLSYEVKRYNRDPKTKRASKEFQQIHPLGKSPVLSFSDDDGNDTKLVESGAIFEFLFQKHDTEFLHHPHPSDPLYKEFLFWLHFSEGSLMGPLSMRYMHQVVTNKVPFFIKPFAGLIFSGMEKAYLTDTIDSMFSYVENTLQKNDYLLGGKLSGADIIMSFPLEAAVAGRIDKTKYPAIVQYVKKLKENENYKKAIEVGGPYDY